MCAVFVSPEVKRRSRDAFFTDGSLELTDITSEARTIPAFDRHERIVMAVDATVGLHAIIALHDRTLGSAIGGCRMWPYATRAAAMTDALRLSRGMTLKAAMAGVAAGGGKAVVLGDSATDKTESMFRAFGRAVDAFDGGYISSQDVGVCAQDVDWMARETRHVLGGTNGVDPSPMTAFGVYQGIKAAVHHRLGRGELAGLVVAVRGLGKVGRDLCERLHKDGARLIVADIDPDRTTEVAEAFDAQPVAPGEIFDSVVDVLAPCALGAILNYKTIPRLKCAVVAGAANNQLYTDRDGDTLTSRSILYAPDYVINGGGLIAVFLENVSDGYDDGRAESMTAAISDTLAEIFQRADAEDRPTNEVADRIALERIARAGERSVR